MVDKEKLRDLVYKKYAEVSTTDLFDFPHENITSIEIFKKQLTIIFNSLIDLAIDVALAEHNRTSHILGRPRKEISKETLVTLRNSSNPPMSYARIAIKLNVSTGTIINRLKELGLYKPLFKKIKDEEQVIKTQDGED